MIHLTEGPVIQEWARPKRKVCDQCKWCHASKLYAMRSSDILFAHCTHEDGGSDLYKRMKEKNPEFWKRGDDLEHDDNNVFTPDWCPIEKLSNQQNRQNL